MGNLSFLIPTKRVEEFTLDNVITLLKPLYPNLKIIKYEQFEKFIIEDNNGNLICEIWKEDCYLLDDIDDDIKYRKDNDLERYKKLKSLNLDKDNCIQVSYGYAIDYAKNRTKIVKDICKEFGCYWLDEGIHPEYSKY